MSTGTSKDYWKDKALPSVFKHDLLKRYLPQFSGMLSRQSPDKRMVYLDGYAGEGRYENGEPASAEIALRVASHFRAQHGVTMEGFFTEAQLKSFERLQKVVEHYRRGGVLAHAHRGEVDGVLDSVLQRAAGRPLFLFLDPCGLVLPQDRLVGVLAEQRRHKRPATELLMNFSMMAVWRLGGHVRSPHGNELALRRFDEVCGGAWWREYFADAAAPGARTGAAEDAIEEVAAEYSRRLAHRTDMFVQSVAVSHAPHTRAVYRLVFATRSPYGLWVFGDTVARARNEWWNSHDLREEEDSEGQLAFFSKRPDPEDLERQAVAEIASNLEQLMLRTRRPFKLVDHTLEVFGGFYGQVTEQVARKAVRLLHQNGKTPSNGVGVRRIREIELRPKGVAA